MGQFAFAAPPDFTPSAAAEVPDVQCAEWIIVRDRELLLPDSEGCSLPRERPNLAYRAIQHLGQLDGVDIAAAAAPSNAEAPSGWSWVGLRSLFGVLDDSRLSLAGRAAQLLDWELCHAYCGRCGAPTLLDRKERCRRCERCGLSAFPRLEPAVIVAVTRAPNEILLARFSRLPQGVHSVLAGFVEPGETLEQCAEREVLEESGIRIKNLKYVASQPWPFPRSLMIGFTAEHATGTIDIDRRELESAAWFPLDRMPPLPSHISIARTLIEVVRARHSSGVE
jgi:NAD+ diphosphatase